MRRLYLILSITIILSGISTHRIKAQTIPRATQVKTYLNNKNFLVSYREGEAVYGTYYFMDIHYCPSGYYMLYGKSVKQTVLGNEQHNNWQEYGTWKVIDLNGKVGVQYITTTGQQSFVPVYLLANGSLFIGQGISFVKQGAAVCR